MLIDHDYSWSTLWSRPRADDEMPIELREAIRCHEAVGKGHFQIAEADTHLRQVVSEGRRERSMCQLLSTVLCILFKTCAEY